MPCRHGAGMGGGSMRQTGSPAGALRVVTELDQLGDQAIAVLALDLDSAVFHRAAGATDLLQAGCQFVQRGARQRQAGNDGDPLAASTGDCTRDPDFRRSRLGGGDRGPGDALEARLVLVDDHAAEGMFGFHWVDFWVAVASWQKLASIMCL